MNDSRSSQNSERQDYVLTSTANQFKMNQNYLTPLSPNIYHLNFQQISFDAQHILSSSPKIPYPIYDVTPHPMNLDQINSKQKETFELDSGNKENIQSNFRLFEPLEYQKLFEKKINFSQVGMSSSKKSQHSISKLSNQSKNFIQRSIHNNIMENSPQSHESTPYQKSPQNNKSGSSFKYFLKQELDLFRFDCNQVQSIPVTSSNETVQTKQVRDINAPLSSSQQPNTYSTGQINLQSIQQAQRLENQRNFEEVPSFNQKQEVLDYFLTEEDEPNEQNDSEEGIQLLSELKSELNSLINGSSQNSQTSSINVSKHARTVQDIRSFGVQSNQESAASKRCRNACDQLAQKLEELKLNILGLHSKICKPTYSTQKRSEISSSRSRNKGIENFGEQMGKWPEIDLKDRREEKKSKKLIYPDSKIIVSRNDGQFVDFNDEFSRVLGESYQEHSKNDSLRSSCVQISSPAENDLRQSSVLSHMHQFRVYSSQKKPLTGTQKRQFHNQTEKRETSSKKTPLKIQIEKQAFIMSYPKLYQPQNDNELSNNADRSSSINLGNSYLSSTSNDGFMLQQLHSKFNSRFNQLFQASN